MINGQFSPLSNNAWKLKATIWEEAKGGYICLLNQPYYLKAIRNIYSKEENFVSSSDTMVSKERQLHFLCSNGRKGRIVCLELKCLFGAQE